MGHGMRLDYGTYAKRGALLGAGLLVLGALGEVVGRVVVGELPAWEQTLLLDAMIIGLLVALVSVIGFGVVLPLTE